VKVTLKISGMHCSDCAVTVQEALASAEVVQSATVSYLRKQAVVEVPEGAEIGSLVTAVELAGYKAEPVGVGQ
jgi:Cu+-exporting ATPase